MCVDLDSQGGAAKLVEDGAQISTGMADHLGRGGYYP